jgi:hypothetical protein
MAAIDDALAALHAEANAKANALIAQSKAEESAKEVSGSALSPDEVSAKISEFKAAAGASAVHPAIDALFDLVKHLLSVVGKNLSDAEGPVLAASDVTVQ